MISEVYDALRAAGASEDESRKAAEAVAAYDNRFAAIDLELAAVHTRFEEVKGSIRPLQWQVAALYAVTVPTLWLVFRIAAKVGALPTG